MHSTQNQVCITHRWGKASYSYTHLQTEQAKGMGHLPCHYRWFITNNATQQYILNKWKRTQMTRTHSEIGWLITMHCCGGKKHSLSWVNKGLERNNTQTMQKVLALKTCTNLCHLLMCLYWRGNPDWVRPITLMGHGDKWRDIMKTSNLSKCGDYWGEIVGTVGG